MFNRRITAIFFDKTKLAFLLLLFTKPLYVQKKKTNAKNCINFCYKPDGKWALRRTETLTL